jgi:hypothetical protein
MLQFCFNQGFSLKQLKLQKVIKFLTVSAGDFGSAGSVGTAGFG